MADLLSISERLYNLSILLVFRFDDTYEHDVLLNHHIPVEEVWRIIFLHSLMSSPVFGPLTAKIAQVFSALQ